jgi:hypothetical protein
MLFIILATDYSPIYVIAMYLLALLCELAAIGLGLTGLVLGCFANRSIPAHRCSCLAVIAALSGTILFFVSHLLDLQPEIDREFLEMLAWLALPPAILALAAFAFTSGRRCG